MGWRSGGQWPGGSCGGTIVMVWAFGDVPSGCAVGVSGGRSWQITISIIIIIIIIIIATIIILNCNRTYDNGPVASLAWLVL